VAYNVKEEDMDDPAACMEPGQERFRPTCIGILWTDKIRTWEIRSGIQRMLGKPKIKGDAKIYELARKQEKRYKKSRKIKGFVDHSVSKKVTALDSRGHARSASLFHEGQNRYVDAQGNVFVRAGSVHSGSGDIFDNESVNFAPSTRSKAKSKGSSRQSIRQSTRRSEPSDPGYSSNEDHRSKRGPKKNKHKDNELPKDQQELLKGFMSQFMGELVQTMMRASSTIPLGQPPITA
jgi:hypothetical protein